MHMATNPHDKLRREIRKLLDGRSQEWLARRSHVGQSTISRLMHGKHQPEPETLIAIAGALDVDPIYLMRLAGIPLPPPATERHETVEYIARRLDELPASVQEYAIAACATIADQFWLLAHGKPANGPSSKGGDEEDEETARNQLARQIAEGLTQQRQGAEDMGEGKRDEPVIEEVAKTLAKLPLSILKKAAEEVQKATKRPAQFQAQPEP